MRSSIPALLGMFVLGACAAVVVQGSASQPAAQTDPGPPPIPQVIPIEVSPRAIAPHGKAAITHLALGRNAYLGKLEMDPGAEVPRHRDPTEEFIHVLQGRGTMTIDDHDYPVEPGTTIYMPAGVEVAFRNGEEPLVAIQVFAGPEPAAKYEAWTPAP